MRRALSNVLAILWLCWIAACGGSGGSTADTTLLTADTRGISGTAGPGSGPLAPGSQTNGSSQPTSAGDTVQREIAAADIYAVDGDLLLLANAYRGLAIVDLAHGALLSRSSLQGFPHELHRRGSRAFVLVGTDGIEAQAATTRLVEFDLVDPTAPVRLRETTLAGAFRDSRRVGDVLYVLTEDGAHSFLLTTTPAAEVAAVALPAPCSFAHATDRFLFVAAPAADIARTTITLLDIGAPGGAIVPRGALSVPGSLHDAQKLHFGNGTLRVVTHDPDGFLSRLFTIGVSDPDAPTVLGQLALARGEQLFGTTFTDDRAYLVTFERVDPLWVIDLADPRQPRVLGELQIPGFSTQLVCSGTQLVALGYDQPFGAPVVSLFEAADPTRPRLLDRVPVGSVDPQAFHERRALSVQQGLVLVPLWDGLAVIDRSAAALTLRGQFAIRGGSKRGLVHDRGLVAIGNEQVVVADPATLAPTAAVTVAENVVAAAQLGDGSLVDVVQVGEEALVRGAALPLFAEHVFAHGARAAVLGWSRSGRVVTPLDLGTAPPTVGQPIELGFGGYAAPQPPRRDLGAPSTGAFPFYVSEAMAAQLGDGLVLLRGLPRAVALTLGDGERTDGLVALDLATGQELPGIEIRGAALTGLVADGAAVVLTVGRGAGYDRGQRPLVRSACYRIDPRTGSVLDRAPVRGAVIAAHGDLVHTLAETWNDDGSWRSSVLALRLATGSATELDVADLGGVAAAWQTDGSTLAYARGWSWIGAGGDPLPGGIGTGIGTGIGNGTVGSGGPRTGGLAPGSAGLAPGSAGMPGLGYGTAAIGTLRLGATLQPGPGLPADAFRRILAVAGDTVLCARNLQSVEGWDCGGAAAARSFAATVDGYPASAFADRFQPNTFHVLAGYGGRVRMP